MHKLMPKTAPAGLWLALLLRISLAAGAQQLDAPIATARVGVGQTVTIQGRVTVRNQLGARQIYAQDETGGIAVYSGPTGPDLTTQVQLGDLVRVGGPVTVFNGYVELTATGGFTVVAGTGTAMPTPVAITPDQLPDYQGRLVSIANTTLTPVAATFSGGTNYTLVAGGQSAILRISANSPLAGAGQSANPVSVTGIADRFVSGATTPGTNGVQIQPRILADIPGTTPATDLTCAVGNGSSLPRDQTLDVAAWNMEFFGADAGTIACPNQPLAYDDKGPTNEDLQQTNAVKVLTNLNADIISTEEVSDLSRFDAAVRSMPGSYSYICSDKFSYFFQNECDQTPTNGKVFGPTEFAQKVCVIYNTATVVPILAETRPLLFQKTSDYTYPSALGGNGSGDGWASGRLPFLFVANVTINGITRKIHVVAVHAKSGSAAADFNRRVLDYNALKAELDASYQTANVVILGDYNDKAIRSIYAGSPVSSFNGFVTDTTHYRVITQPLEQNDCVTYNPSGGSFIDHIIISNKLQPAYIAGSVYVLRPFSIPNYGNTTSDHSPIEARFDLSQLASPVAIPLATQNAAGPDPELRVTLLNNPTAGAHLGAMVQGAEGRSLQLELRDMAGRLVGQQSWPSAASGQRVDWNLSGQPGGVYLLRATLDARPGQSAQQQGLKVILN